MKFSLLFAAALLALPAFAQPRLKNGVAVIVNDAIITYQDIQLPRPDVELLHRRYGSRPSQFEEKVREMERERLEDLVQQELILNEFKTAGYNIPESYIEGRISETIREHGGRLSLTKTLQSEGMTFEAYRKKVRERAIVELMWQANISSEVLVSPYKIDQYYQNNQERFALEDQVKLKMIVFPNRPEDPTYSARKIAEETLAKLDEGVPFEEMARIYSHGSQRSDGGEWGWVERSVLREDLAEKAFALEKGERSGVVEAPDGCYIMLVEDRRAAHIKPLSDVRDEIEATLRAEENRRLRQQWIDRLKEKSFIRYFSGTGVIR